MSLNRKILDTIAIGVNHGIMLTLPFSKNDKYKQSTRNPLSDLCAFYQPIANKSKPKPKHEPQKQPGDWYKHFLKPVVIGI